MLWRFLRMFMKRNFVTDAFVRTKWLVECDIGKTPFEYNSWKHLENYLETMLGNLLGLKDCFGIVE